jgi:DNA polymerase III alpha subunit (gram-positive type)
MKVKSKKITTTNYVSPPKCIKNFDIDKSMYIVVDLETTGFVKEHNGITEIVTVCLDCKGRIIEESRYSFSGS